MRYVRRPHEFLAWNLVYRRAFAGLDLHLTLHILQARIGKN
jgi:hypothetical protein